MESQGIDALLALCRTGTPEEQCRAIVDLEAMGAREVVPVAAEALGQLGERWVMPELRAQLAVDQSPLARASLLSALYQLGDEAALALLLDGVEGMDDQTAVTVLGMAADVTRPQHAALLRSRLETLVRSRQALAAEARSLLRKAPGSTSE